MEGPKVQLFVTCLVDALAPHVGRSTVAALEACGAVVEFPEAQGCCGQPAFNVGLVEDARQMAGQTLDVLDVTEGPIVVPSGSCAAMMAHHFTALFAGTDRSEQSVRVGARVRELSQYLVDDLDSDAQVACGGCTVVYHYSCHGLRELGLSDQADRLMSSTNRVPLEDDRECCGFGGLFSIEMPAISTAIMDEKLDRIIESGADTVVGSDVSCLMHIEGGLRRRGVGIDVKHLAELIGDAS